MSVPSLLRDWLSEAISTAVVLVAALSPGQWYLVEADWRLLWTAAALVSSLASALTGGAMANPTGSFMACVLGLQSWSRFPLQVSAQPSSVA
eukprot:g27505.t1